jgi:hypothetical protein
MPGRETLEHLAGGWEVAAKRNRVHGQLAIDQGDEYGSEGFSFAAALETCASELRATVAVIAAQQPKPAPEVRPLGRHVDHDPSLVCRPAGRDLCEVWTATVPQPAPELAALRERIGNLAAGIKRSADSTRPSKKTSIEDGCAAALLGLLDPR